MADAPLEDHYEGMPPGAKETLNDIGDTLSKAIPPGWGFALLMFEYGPDGTMSWISSAQRADMCNALEEMLFKLRKGVPH